MTIGGTTLAIVALLATTASCRADSITSFCESRGGTIASDVGENTHPTPVCVLKDGSRMNAVAFFRNQHRTSK